MEVHAPAAHRPPQTRPLLLDRVQVFTEQDLVWIQDLKGRLRCAEPQLRALIKSFCEREKVGAKVYVRLNADYRATAASSSRPSAAPPGAR